MARRAQFISGVVLGLAVAAVLSPLYSDPTNRQESRLWLDQSGAVQRAVQAKVIKTGTVQNSGLAVDKGMFQDSTVRKFELTTDGTLIIKGGSSGQLIVMSPVLDAGKVKWRCVGGSGLDTYIFCRPGSNDKLLDTSGG